ncbi:Clp protease N-terminal domain-containing protein [Streptomyces olindensis]|uniref:Clp protease N-terminal domain-containing protein n=1 Tax=Streptomyces olindensis TaxID=358823 RepID=UPI00049FB498|nr:peptidase [Streptomyces olindensis]
MFERFTADARDVVKTAFEYVQGDGGGGQCVEPEHLLLALLDRDGSRGASALAALGLPPGERRESVREALREARRRAGLSRAESDALAGLGIDVAEIVARVEEVHGVGAMSGDRKDARWWSGRPSFGRGAKDVLERSLKVALAQRDRHIGDEHLLLSLTLRPGVPAEVLADHGVTYESLVRVLYGGGGEAKAG